MSVKCLIIAAGSGSRLRRMGGCKPLIPLLGAPLIERELIAFPLAEGEIALTVDGDTLDGCDGEIARLKHMQPS